MKEYKSFYKTVGGNEGDKCHYPTRLDTYGCGCQHNCSYCYARSLLDFRGLWDADDPAVADINKIRRKLDKIEPGSVLRLGGMTDCFQPAERIHRVTYETIKLMNERRIEYLIVTKSDLVAEYADIMDKDLAHIQITVTTLDDKLCATYERATPPSQRVAAILKLQNAGFDVAIRLSPIIEDYMDFDKLNSLGINKAVAEFLRVNPFIEKWFDIDYSHYILKQGNYKHLDINDKLNVLDKIKIPSVTICEDFTEHYEFWKHRYNPSSGDCCNLRRRTA